MTLKPGSLPIYFTNVWFKYEKNLPGKTTALSIINGINKAYRGKVLTNSKSIVQLPQNPQNLFIKKTVDLDLYEMLCNTKLTK